jgi:glutamine synthetase
MSLGIDTLPELNRDPGDRNRTSPFAFTGNRFEFRAVGSGQSVAGPLVVLNTMLADAIAWIADQLEDQLSTGSSLEEAAFAVLKRTMDDHGAVVFGGDGYSSEWHRIAVEERGLENLRTSADALPVLQRPEIRELFERQGVLTPVELESRFDVYAEQYILAIEVEAKLVLRIARTQILPVVSTAIARLSQAVKDLEGLGLPHDRSLVESVASQNSALIAHCAALETALQAEHRHDPIAQMQFCKDTLLPLMGAVRAAADALEAVIDDDLWPLPTYQELLFMR